MRRQQRTLLWYVTAVNTSCVMNPPYWWMHSREAAASAGISTNALPLALHDPALGPARPYLAAAQCRS